MELNLVGSWLKSKFGVNSYFFSHEKGLYIARFEFQHRILNALPSLLLVAQLICNARVLVPPLAEVQRQRVKHLISMYLETCTYSSLYHANYECHSIRRPSLVHRKHWWKLHVCMCGATSRTDATVTGTIDKLFAPQQLKHSLEKPVQAPPDW